MKNKLFGKDGFEKYYSEKFGNRWVNLKKALLEPINYFSLKEGLTKTYFLDKASYLAVNKMPVLDFGNCLDMCAAPGGKTLVLATKILKGENTFLQANEISANRRGRLKKVIHEHLPENLQQRISVTPHNGSLMCKSQQNYFDRILVDTPCSSERHILAQKKYLNQWTKARIKNLSYRQWSLLSSAFLLLKPEGFLIYSTCALSETENDLVVDKLIAKYKNAKIINIPPFENAETCRNGLIFLPDTSGYGPLYFALIKKL